MILRQIILIQSSKNKLAKAVKEREGRRGSKGQKGQGTKPVLQMSKDFLNYPNHLNFPNKFL